MRGLEWSRHGECQVGKCETSAALRLEVSVLLDPTTRYAVDGSSCGEHVGELAQLLRNGLADKLAVIADGLDPLAVRELPSERAPAA